MFCCHPVPPRRHYIRSTHPKQPAIVVHTPGFTLLSIMLRNMDAGSKPAMTGLTLKTGNESDFERSFRFTPL